MSEDATKRDAEAMEWLVNQWSEEVIGQVRASSLASPRLFGDHRRGSGAGISVQAANQLAFAAVNVVLTMVEGAAGLARRHFAETLGVAMPVRPPTAASPAPQPAPDQSAPLAFPQMAAAPPPSPASETYVSELPLRLAIQNGDKEATCSFVVENATGRPLHTVRFGLSYLTAGPDKVISPSHASFEPAVFELRPYQSAVVTAHIRTAGAKPGSYLGVAESGRLRQVITLEVT